MALQGVREGSDNAAKLKEVGIANASEGTASQDAIKNQVEEIIRAGYDVAVTDPNLLNKYGVFSSETYGEISVSLVRLWAAAAGVDAGR